MFRIDTETKYHNDKSDYAYVCECSTRVLANKRSHNRERKRVRDRVEDSPLEDERERGKPLSSIPSATQR